MPKYSKLEKWEFPYGNIIDKDKPIDPDYLRDAQETFKSNGGNGWWWYEGCKLDVVPMQFRKQRGKY